MKIKKTLQSEGNKIYKIIKKQYTYVITRKDCKISIINEISEVFTKVKIKIVIL
jgi:hypothetical protein